MSAGERIRYERAEAAKTNKAAADEAMRKIKTLVGDQDRRGREALYPRSRTHWDPEPGEVG